jgi:hypothetical protein
MERFGKMTDHYYLAVIGDIRRSRELKERSATQVMLEQTMASLNETLPQELVGAKFAITLGDEFQGLLLDPEAAVRVLVHVETSLPHVTLRYGLGWGPVETALRDEAVGMDGPCFHHAREALQESKERDRWGTARGFGKDGDTILTGLLSVLGAVREGWTEKQALTVALARDAQTQREVASALSVGPSTVSEALSAALYGPVSEAERALAKALAAFGRIPDDSPNSEEEPNS